MQVLITSKCSLIILISGFARKFTVYSLNSLVSHSSRRELIQCTMSRFMIGMKACLVSLIFFFCFYDFLSVCTQDRRGGENDKAHRLALGIISKVGLSLSIPALLLVIITACIYK